MNFLSHYYLHSEKIDNYFTVGLTVPDVLGFHSRKIRLTKKILKELGANEQDQKIKNFIAGMILHLKIDSWFHKSIFFKEKVEFLQESYKDFNEGKHRLPHFYAHIITEVLIDRYLLVHKPNVVDDFYKSYKDFDFSKISGLFRNRPSFEEERFLSLANSIANSSFLREYINDGQIFSILQRVSNRIKLPMIIKVNEDMFAEYINYAYKKLEKQIKTFLENAKKKININKQDILKEMVII